MISKQVLLNFINLFPDDTWFLPYIEYEEYPPDDSVCQLIIASNKNYKQLGYINNNTEEVTLKQ